MIRLFNAFRRASVVLLVLTAATHHAHAQIITEDAKFIAPGAGMGHAVVTTGDYIIVGGSQANSVYVLNQFTGQVVREFVAPVPNRAFGFSLAASGDTLVIGMPGQDPNSQPGFVFVYRISTGELIHAWQQPNLFGRSVAIDGNRVLVGAPGEVGFSVIGSAYLYNLASGTLIAQIQAPSPSATDLTGNSVALSGGLGLIGAPQTDQNFTNSGSALLIDSSTGALLDVLVSDDPSPFARFGISVAISAGRAVIGKPNDTSAIFNAGSAYIYDLTTRQQLHKLTAETPASNSFYGFTVTIEGDTVLVGAPFSQSSGAPGGTPGGFAELFNTTTGQRLASLVPSDPTSGFQFARGLSIRNTIATIGSPGHAAVYRYQLTAARITEQPESTVAEANTEAYFEVSVAHPAVNTVTYQWRLNGKPIADGPDFKDTQGPGLTVRASDATIGFYDCVISRPPLPPVTTARAVLAVLPDPNACYADANNDGQLNFFDIARYIQLFNAGCP